MGVVSATLRSDGRRDRRRLGMARGEGRNAAVAAGAGREGALHLLRAVSRRPGPVRARRSDRSPPDRGRPRAAQADHRLRADLLDRSWPRPDSGNRQAARHQGDAGAVAVEPSGPQRASRSRQASRWRSAFRTSSRRSWSATRFLLRGEMGAPELARTIREVKAQVPMPVTYADVWEFWLAQSRGGRGGRFHHHPYPAVLGGLPDPGQRRGTARRRHPPAGGRGVSRAGTSCSASSAGRAPAACARAPCRRRPIRRATIQEVLALAKRENYRANLIEAYDQPWKRQLEGTVGGHWGLYDAYRRQAKFAWGAPVSNHPDWPGRRRAASALPP